METMQGTTTLSDESRKVAALTKCAHAGCTCTIDEGERFCSDYCLEQVNATEHNGDHECQCGHAECTHEIVKPVMEGTIVS